MWIFKLHNTEGSGVGGLRLQHTNLMSLSLSLFRPQLPLDTSADSLTVAKCWALAGHCDRGRDNEMELACRAPPFRSLGAPGRGLHTSLRCVPCSQHTWYHAHLPHLTCPLLRLPGSHCYHLLPHPSDSDPGVVTDASLALPSVRVWATPVLVATLFIPRHTSVFSMPPAATLVTLSSF